MEIKERILTKAREQFFRYGVKSITMDDIAKELGISKKTIYQHYEDKDDLVYQLMTLELDKDRCLWEEIQQNSLNPIDMMVKAMDVLKQSLMEINSSALFDIKKYHPRTWQYFENHKQTFIFQCITTSLVQGIQQGMFRKELNIEIIARMRMQQIEMGFDTQVFAVGQFTVLEVQLEFLDHFVRGILTKEGLELYEEYLTIKKIGTQ